jgi:hypothetical protein
VLEIWRYDGKQAYIYKLANQVYEQTSASLAFPSLISVALTEFIEQSKTQGQTAALAAFRKWWRAQT